MDYIVASVDAAGLARRRRCARETARRRPRHAVIIASIA